MNDDEQLSFTFDSFDDDRTNNVLDEVYTERRRQDSKWGEQNHPDGTFIGNKEGVDEIRKITDEAFAAGRGTWADILGEEVAEALAEEQPALLRAELIQVAAVCVAWVECIDRRNGWGQE